MIYTEDFFEIGSSFPNDDVIQLVDSNTKENVNYIKITSSGSFSDDGVIYRKKGDIFYLRQFYEAANVLWFGAKGDGITDDTASIQKAVDICAGLGLRLYVPSKNFVVKNIRLKNGLKAFYSDGARLIGMNSLAEGIIEGGGTFFGSDPVSCEIFGFELDCNHIVKRGIFLATAFKCMIHSNKIYNLSVQNDSIDGICLHFNSSKNQVYNNIINLPINITAMGIYLMSNTKDLYAGWMSYGSIVESTDLNFDNIVSNNYISGGSHGINLSGSISNSIKDNVLTSQRDRSIILSPISTHNVISGNKCLDFGSSGIHMAYGSSDNVIHDNICLSPASHGEAGIQAYVACKRNKIRNNSISCTSNYGIYLAVDAINNEVRGNTIKGNVHKAVIAIESTWVTSLHTDAMYSRPSVTPMYPRLFWANEDSAGNIIEDNMISDINLNSCGIYIAQVLDRELFGNYINNNKILGQIPAHYLYVFEESQGKNKGNFLSQNKFSENNNTKIFFSNGRSHFKEVKDNAILNDYDFFDLPKNLAIIDVSKNDYISTAAYDLQTNIESFIGGIEGQEIVMRMSVYTGFTTNGNIRPISIGLSGADANDISIFRYVRGKWMEIYRSYN